MAPQRPLCLIYGVHALQSHLNISLQKFMISINDWIGDTNNDNW